MEFMTVDQINIKLISLVRNERKLTEEILNHIILFQKCGGYLKLGYSSMHQYMTRMLGYSDDQAYRRLKAAQLLKDVPEIGDQLKSGEINLSQASEVQKAIETAQKETKNPVSKEKKKKIIKSIEKANNFNTKNILANELNLKPKEHERATPQSNQTVRLEINLTPEQFEKLKTIKSILSHKLPSQNTAEILEILFDQYLNKNSLTKESKMQKSSSDPFTKKNKASQRATNSSMKENKVIKVFVDTFSETNKTPQCSAESLAKESNATKSSNDNLAKKSVGIISSSLESLSSKDSLKTSRALIKKHFQNSNLIHPDQQSRAITSSPITVCFMDSQKTSDLMSGTSQKISGLGANLGTHKDTSKRKRYIPLSIRRAVFHRANHCCEFIGSNNERCQSRYQLEMDHFIKPYSQGGEHSLENLKLHCSQHNSYRASQCCIGLETRN